MDGCWRRRPWLFCIAILLVVPTRAQREARAVPARSTPAVKRALPPGFVAKPGTKLHANGYPLEIVCTKDGSEMVLVPGGRVRIGSDAADAEADEKPVHDETVPPFYIDKFEVANSQYEQFVKATSRAGPDNRLYKRYSLWLDDAHVAPAWIASQPVINVTWADAQDYCRWAGKRLPTETQWELAAGGVEKRRFPWGDAAPSPQTCLFHKDWDHSKTLADVSSLPKGAGPYGCHHMAGNVWEWCLDWYDPERYRRIVESREPKDKKAEAAATKPTATRATGTRKGDGGEAADAEEEDDDDEPFVPDPHGPFRGQLRAVRGGGWWSPAANLRVTNRLGYWPKIASGSIGFRGCRPLPSAPSDPTWAAKARKALLKAAAEEKLGKAMKPLDEAWRLAQARLDDGVDREAIGVLEDIEATIRRKVKAFRDTMKVEPQKVEPDLYEEIALLAERKYYHKIELDRTRKPDVAALVSQLDPYSAFISPQKLASFRQQVSSEFSGVGIQISKVDEVLTVISPLVGSPAYKAGIMAGDQIIGVDGEPTKGWDLSKAVERITGKTGTVVKLEISRKQNGKSVKNVYPITRATLKIESILGVYRHEDNSWGYWVDRDEKLAAIRVTSFLPDTADRLKETIGALRNEGLRGLVLDLRTNSGGLLKVAYELSNLFIASGTIVSIRDRHEAQTRLDATRDGTWEDLALVVLINRFSASASEIFAGAIQDHRRGLVVGQRSWGKASVQTVEPLDGGRAGILKLTTGTYFSAGGRNYHRHPLDDDEKINAFWGVIPRPDLYVPMGITQFRKQMIDARREHDVVRHTHGPGYQPKPLIDDQMAAAIAALRREMASRKRLGAG